jgi:lipopolysaccharide export LptBFGC system permease protein LptF
MGFIEKLFLALGKGDRIPAVAAAWSSDVIFLVIGCYLLYLRANNRDFPTPSFRWKRK